MDAAARYDLDSRVSLHPLVYLADGDEVTIGRRDIDSYGIFPPDGAELVRRLEAGNTPREVDRWYQREYGERTDIAHVLAALAELNFLADAGQRAEIPAPLRGQRLGAVLFSAPVMVLYGLLITWCMAAMVRSPELVPTYRHLFFTEYYSVIELTLFAGAVPLLVLHELFHVLAARRLGVRSRVRLGRRLYYVVVETSLDGLVAVPRRQRYLPILAGMLADLLALAALTLAADLTRAPGGGLSTTGRVCLALAFATLLRLAWQFFFYLRTDLYALLSTMLGCVDLHTTAKRLLRNQTMRALGRRDRVTDESRWHPADRRTARWYSWLIVAGYTFSLTTFAIAVAPAVLTMLVGSVGRLADDATGLRLFDSVVFLGLNVGQLLLIGWQAVRERRERSTRQLHHVVA